jgi:hypothetical protein
MRRGTLKAMTTAPPREPSEDRIIAHYMPSATQDEKQETRENLRQSARLLLRIENRLVGEWRERRIRESGDAALESDGRPQPPL